MRKRGIVKAIALDVGADNALPTEFRIFRAGVNETTGPPMLFDDKAAALVMAAYAEHAVDITIDLQHDSINDAARVARNDAADARGSCKLEVRNGELWAVDVTWTPDGARRLLERTQRYISPVAFYDAANDNRVTSIFNLALVSMPATHGADPLVAARKLENSMDPKLIQEALDALIAGDAEACATILKSLVVEAAGGDAGEPPAADAGTDATAQAADPMPPKQDEPPPAAMAASADATVAALRTALKVETPVAVLAAVNALKAQVDALTLAAQAEEMKERRDLVGQLVKLGAEIPATAWKDSDAGVPVDRLADEPIADLRERVAALAAAPRADRVAAPKRNALDVAALSDLDQARAEQITDPAARARFVAARLSHGGAR